MPVRCETTCRHCGIKFAVEIHCIPERGGCYCPECGEYIPYAWDKWQEKGKNKTTFQNEFDKYLKRLEREKIPTREEFEKFSWCRKFINKIRG